MRAALAIATLLIATHVARVAHASPEADGDRAYRAAEAHAVAGDPRAIDELEALGAARPITRWTDNAWAEAGKLAERAADLPRARRDYEHARELSADPLLVRRVTAALARVAPLVSWNELDAAHDALVGRIQAPVGDPALWLCELGVLVDANPRYPRALAAMLELARGWERDGDFATARMWLERAEALPLSPEAHEHVLAERVRFEMRGGGDVAAGRRALAQLRDPQLRAVLDGELSRSEWRRRLRTASWLLLGVLAACAGFALVRARAGWRALLRPPIEVWFVAPIAAVIAGIAATGNPLVSRAVRMIALAGVAIAWLTGALARPRTAWHAALRAALAVLAAAAAVYLAVDRDRMIDIVLETWREGMAGR